LLHAFAAVAASAICGPLRASIISAGAAAFRTARIFTRPWPAAISAWTFKTAAIAPRAALIVFGTFRAELLLKFRDRAIHYFFQLTPVQPDTPALGAIVDLYALLLGLLHFHTIDWALHDGLLCPTARLPRM
jgi:hypothetical protein